MDHLLQGCDAKLERADEHLQALNSEIPRFLAEEPHAYRGHIDAQAGRYIVTVHINRQPPIEWSVIVGDFIHNLRSALDHLVWQLVILNGKTPIGGPGGNQFPIFTEKPGDLRRRNCRLNKQLRGVHRSVRAAIQQIQPYHRRLGADPQRVSLAVLAMLSNEDKHQAILPSYAAIPKEPLENGLPLNVTAIRDVAEIKHLDVHVNKPLVDSAEVMTTDITVTGPNPDVKMEGELPFEVAFGEAMVPMASLVAVRNTVHTVFELLRPVSP